MDKLTEIQQKLKAPKNQFNEFGKYKYRSCEDILEAVKPLLNDCRLTISDKMVQLGSRYYVEATAKFFDGKEETIVTASAREQEIKKGMDESQITGSASSYARKYALNGLFLIDDTKDADTMDNTKEKKTTAADTSKGDNTNEMSSKQWNFIKSIGLKAHELTEQEVIDMVKWVAEKNNLSPRHWKMSKILLPEENFNNVFQEYCEYQSSIDIKEPF